MFMIILFGIAKDIVGARELPWPDAELKTVGELRRWLLASYPAFADLASLRVAVNEEYAEDELVLHPGDEIVLIPPVAGG